MPQALLTVRHVQISEAERMVKHLLASSVLTQHRCPTSLPITDPAHPRRTTKDSLSVNKLSEQMPTCRHKNGESAQDLPGGRPVLSHQRGEGLLGSQPQTSKLFHFAKYVFREYAFLASSAVTWGLRTDCSLPTECVRKKQQAFHDPCFPAA